MIDYEQFESFDAEKQAEVFRQSTIKEKGELLIRSHHPSGLVRGLSQEELYLVAREMDQEERSEILRYADFAQLCFFSDIECWSRDRLSIKGFMTWLETLRLADDLKLLQWLIESDYELVVSGLKMMIQVVKAEREYAVDELLGDAPYFTLDENYFIAVQEENLEIIRRVFEILFENHRGRYVAILEGILCEVEDQLEEEAYNSRERRLSERGFPSPESAHIIFKSITPEEFEDFPKKTESEKSDPIISEETVKKNTPNYLSLWNKDRIFLDDLFSFLAKDDIKAFDQVREELAWLANKVIACDGIDFSSEEKVKRGIERARRFVSLGLEILTQKDFSKAEKLLKERWLETIFRSAATELNHLRESALGLVRHYWNGSQEECLNFLDSPYDYMFRGFLRLVPEFYEPQAKSEILYRDFVSLEDLARARRALKQLECIHEVFERKVPGALEMAHQSIREKGDHAITLFQLMIQCYAWFVIKGKLEFKVLKTKDAAEFFDNALVSQGQKNVLNSEHKETFLKALFTPDEKGLLTPIWSLAFQELQEECENLDRKKLKNDFKFIRHLWIKG